MKDALLREPTTRAAFIESACSGDEALRTELTWLLTSVEQLRTESPDSSAAPGAPAQKPHSEETTTGGGKDSELERGDSLGRYVILEMIGSGGMGVVYAAHDPELDRKIAIKVLRPEASKSLIGTDARARLLREAQAMARLSHNNVVNVYDVGTIGDEVFIAMEYVEGCTLKEWLEAKPRKSPEIVAMFVQAGRGLSAAHSTGIVHRDFKPHNVLVGKDGRARVLDFGLARGSIGAETAETVQMVAEGVKATSSGLKALASDITKTGVLIGTPAYMAPELITGAQVDARSDQFSFCASLYQALYGELPFGGETLKERLAAIREGRLSTPRSSATVPGWLRQVVIKGLSSDASARYPSMEALLHKLQQNPAKIWRRAIAIAAIVLLITVAPWLSYRVIAQRQSALCRGAEDKLAGIWDSARQEAIQRAFSGTAKPYASDAFNGVKRALDAQTRDWVNMHNEACQATRLRGEQSEALLDLRMECLRDRLGEMRALTNLFAQADAQVVEKSAQAANLLTPLGGCADPNALLAQVKPPSDLATRAQVEKLRNTLADIKAVNDTGSNNRALQMTRSLLPEARATHYAPIEAEALLMLGGLLQTAKQPKDAEEQLRLAANSAEEAHDDQRRAQALRQLAFVVGYQQRRMDEGLRIAQEALALTKRLGNPPSLDAAVQQVVALILLQQGNRKEAIERLKQALETRQTALGPEHPDVALTLSNLGNALSVAGRYDESLEFYRRALQVSENALGPEHPYVATALNNLGALFMKQGKFDEALEAQRRALAIREKAFGPVNAEVAVSLMNVGAVLASEHRLAEALPFFQRAVEIKEKTLGPEHADVADALSNLGTLFKEMGDIESGLPYLRRGLAITEKVFGPEHARVATRLTQLGQAIFAQGNFQSALELFRRALAIQEKTLGPSHAEVAETLISLGTTLYEQNKRDNFDLAVDYLNRALGIREKTVGPESAPVADVLATLGSLEGQRKPTTGLVHLQRALAIREKTLPRNSRAIGIALSRIGQVYLKLRQPREAKTPLERAVKLLDPTEKVGQVLLYAGDRAELALARFLLARALWETNSDRQRAIALAQQAHATLLKAGKSRAENLREVQGWLSARANLGAESTLGVSRREQD